MKGPLKAKLSSGSASACFRLPSTLAWRTLVRHPSRIAPRLVPHHAEHRQQDGPIHSRMRMSTTIGHETVTATNGASPDRSAWRSIVARYQGSDVSRSMFQLVTTTVLLTLAFVVMHWSLSVSYFLTLALSVPTAGLLVRTFIIMHDCAHGSFFPSRRANEVVGYLTGVVTLTPFEQWRRDHALHHASSGDLDRRGHGDIQTLTVDEYRALGRWERFKYRFYRNAFVMLVIGPIYLMIHYRRPAPSETTRAAKAASVHYTNLVI